MTDNTSQPSNKPDDPVYLHTRREALVILGLWAAAMLWTVPYCYFFGYHPLNDPEQLKTILGMPDWVFWGVLAPWAVSCLATIYLCFWFIVDDDLEA